MISLGLAILAVGVIGLMAGPISHFSLINYGGPELFIISSWALVWFADYRLAIRWAIVAGLLLDFLSFSPFGYWTLLLVLTTFLINYLLLHFLEVSSPIQALVALLSGIVFEQLITSIVVRQFVLPHFLVSVISSLLIGAVLYYIFAIRFKLLQRWLGRRL